MEMVVDPQQACQGLSKNGYVNRNFLTKPEARNMGAEKICNFDQCDINGVVIQPGIQELAVKYEKKAKTTRIWGFVRKKRLNSGRTKRPQSMILTGEILDPKPRMSFFERMRSIKRLRSSTFAKNTAAKNSEATVTCISIENVEEDRASAFYRTKKSLDSQRPFRHSYAGYIDDLDSSFEDVELNITASDYDVNDSRWLRDVNVRLNGETDRRDSNTLPVTRKEAFQFPNSKSCTIAEGEVQRQSHKMPTENRRGRSTDVWSYLKGISLTSKENSKMEDTGFANNGKGVELTSDISSSSSDLDKRDEQTQRSNNVPKSKNLSGVFRFFSNVAVAARKWRGSSKGSTKEEVSSTAPAYAHESSSCSSALVTENENSEMACSKRKPLQSPDSGIQDNQTPRSSTPLQGALKQALQLDLFDSACTSDLTADTGCSTDVPLSAEELHQEPSMSSELPLCHQVRSDTLEDTEEKCTATEAVSFTSDVDERNEKGSLGLIEDTNSLLAEKGSPDEQSQEDSEFSGSLLSISTTSSSNEDKVISEVQWQEDTENSRTSPEPSLNEVHSSITYHAIAGHSGPTHSQSADTLCLTVKGKSLRSYTVNVLLEAPGEFTESPVRNATESQSHCELRPKSTNGEKSHLYLEADSLEHAQFPQVLLQKDMESNTQTAPHPGYGDVPSTPHRDESADSLCPILKRDALPTETVNNLPETNGEVTELLMANHVTDNEGKYEFRQKRHNSDKRTPYVGTNLLEVLPFPHDLLEEPVDPRNQVLSVAQDLPAPCWRDSFPGSAHSQLSNTQCTVLEEEIFHDDENDNSIDGELEASMSLPANVVIDSQTKRERYQKSNHGDRLRTFSVAHHLGELQSRQTLPHPPHPLTRAPAFKIPLDRYHSLPLSQSTPTGLDQVGWMKRMLLSAADADLGSKTLEGRRDSRRIKSRWKPLIPASEQHPLHK